MQVFLHKILHAQQFQSHEQLITQQLRRILVLAKGEFDVCWFLLGSQISSLYSSLSFESII